MSPPQGDISPSPEPKSAGGFVSVFKGLTGSKLVKSPLPSSLPSSNTPISPDRIDSASLAATGLPPHHLESLEKLKTETLIERIAAAESLRLAIADYPLNSVLQIWDAAKDLIQSSQTSAARIAGWGLLTECVKNPSSTDLERQEYFQILSAPANPEDFHLQLAALVDLTNHGRNLSGFDYQVFPLLTTWLQDAYTAVRTARRRAARDAKDLKDSKDKNGNSGGTVDKGKIAAAVIALGEDKNFSQLFDFILEVLKFNFKVANDETVAELMDSLLIVCTNTSAEDDLSACIGVIDAVLTYGYIPKRKLARCVEVIGSIHCMVPSLAKTSWHTLSNLLKSHNGQAVVQILLNVLRQYSRNVPNEKDASRDVRGALSVLQKLIWKTSEKGYPSIPLALLIDGCNNVVTKSNSSRTASAILKLIYTLFDDGEQQMSSLLEEEDWTSLFSVVEKVASRKSSMGVSSSQKWAVSNTSQASLVSTGDDTTIMKELEKLIHVVESLFIQSRTDFTQRHECIAFLAKLNGVLPDSAAGLVLDHFDDFRSCYPSDLEWEDNLQVVLDAFYLDRDRSTSIRLRALRSITEVYNMLELVEDELDEDCVPNLVKNILSGISEETDTLVLQETVSFMVAVGCAADRPLFDYIVDTLKGIITSERLRPPIASLTTSTHARTNSHDEPHDSVNQSPANVVTRGYVQMFIRTMKSDAHKASHAFSVLVFIAKCGISADARLTAMKLLFRLRADWAHRIYITPFTESEGLAGVLYRTEASLARKLADDAAQPQRMRNEHGSLSRSSRGVSFGHGQPHERVVPSRSTSGTTTSHQKYQQLWALPDPDALPEAPSSSASPVLFSYTERRLDLDEAGSQVGLLDIASWVEAVLHILTQGCDWEVYSFNLVHLPSQLSNHALFRAAIPQIQEARRVLCEQSRMNLFQDPPPASGLRRPEVNICIFQMLTMIMSYHQHFQKSDEDDLVRTFMQGIAHQTAKTCIHALTICCHELPMASTKALVTILQRMSSVITSPFVAMHILEFLAGLARLPSLYSNFREDEFRIVFVICFRYLDTVRDKKRYGRNSLASEPSASGINTAAHEYDVLGQPTVTEDLPQYVYALAYHVISFWFLALRISDRAKHVRWIAKRLFQDPDGGMTADEQALITIDFMQRVAYADADESEENPRFSDRKAAEFTERRWIIANSIVSIKQSKTTPWAQITKRQPSGISYFTVRENFKPPPAHLATPFGASGGRDTLTTNSAIPSHLLVHLLSSMPQSSEPALRPILLPEDDAVGRSIRLFDLTSTVDGHKVGVIYIGENQTTESEILSNVSGSSDYIEFLNGLGTLTKLKGADFNTHGLDRAYDTDGQYTFCWRDRVTEMVFHVTTQMPTNPDHDPNCVGKKRHIGNCFVNIIFNDSGLPFKFDTFPSEFNYVYIVISPESRASFVATREHAAKRHEERGEGRFESFFKVQVMSKEGFPEISPAAATKMVSLKALPEFIRLLSLNASVFSQVWASRKEGEYPSSWRSRLREINRLRERYAPRTVNPSPSSSSISGALLGNALTGVPGASASQQPQIQPAQSDSRPSSSVRDSFSSLRRASVATFLTSNSDQNSQSHRSSMISAATADTEMLQPMNIDNLVDSLDFSKWA